MKTLGRIAVVVCMGLCIVGYMYQLAEALPPCPSEMMAVEQ